MNCDDGSENSPFSTPRDVLIEGDTSLLHIRSATPEDAELLHHLSRLTFIQTFTGATSDEDMYAYLDEAYAIPVLEQELACPESEFYICEYSDPNGILPRKIAGYLKINVGSAQTEPMENDDLEIQRIYVLEEFKGIRIGSEFMRIVQERARALGKRRIWLGVWEFNESAQRFYAHCGFTRIGEHTFTTGKEVQTDWILAKVQSDEGA